VVAGMLEIDPKTHRVIRRLEEPEGHECRDIILDEETIAEFNGKKVHEPKVSSRQCTEGDRAAERTLVSSPIYIRNRLHGLINLLLPDRFSRLYQGQMDVLAILTNAAASAIVNQRLYQNVRAAFLQAIKALANAVEARDKYTAGHTDRVIKLAEQVATHLRWNKRQIETMTVGCMLHDIGKIGVPDSILNKPDQLDEREREIMRNHPNVGLRIVREIELFKPAIPYIISHHERYDGTGYPKGLKGNMIPIEGRLLSVVDTFDAIMSDRPYRRGAQLATAIDELVNNKGKQFDPDMVDAFLEVLRNGGVNFVDLYGREVDVTCLDMSLTSAMVSA
jgi:putative nucleotidyltransferase with HDIG domain